MQKNDTELLLNIPQAANLLQIASHTLRVWLSKGEVIPMEFVRKLGRRTLIHKKSLVEWIDNGCKKDLNAEKQKGTEK